MSTASVSSVTNSSKGASPLRSVDEDPLPGREGERRRRREAAIGVAVGHALLRPHEPELAVIVEPRHVRRRGR